MNIYKVLTPEELEKLSGPQLQQYMHQKEMLDQGKVNAGQWHGTNHKGKLILLGSLQDSFDAAPTYIQQMFYEYVKASLINSGVDVNTSLYRLMLVVDKTDADSSNG